jgi:wyosine [tRNA(Phe)-imidazoG37] synthetase (radical SAM superfamily)
MTGTRKFSGFRNHETHWRDFQYVYPVISRRAAGLSLGINLNPDKACNFDCVYCQVDKSIHGTTSKVDLGRLEHELVELIHLHQSGGLYEMPPFADTPEDLKELKSITMAGDGEPTTFEPFSTLLELVTGIKNRFAGPDVKCILITNASRLHVSSVSEALDILSQNNGEIWTKLDAGSEGFYQKINRTHVPFPMILRNIAQTARRHPVRIQTLFCKFDGCGPHESEIQQYICRLTSLKLHQPIIREVQIYTVARKPRSSRVTELEVTELEPIAQKVRSVADWPVRVYSS